MLADARLKGRSRSVSRIKLLILDVDGVLTSGALPYGIQGNTDKTFHVQDGSAIKRWQKTGRQIAVLSGRSAAGVDARCRDLGIDMVVQGAPDKTAALPGILEEAGATVDETAAVGDDLPDLPVFAVCQRAIAVANAHRRAKRAAEYVTRRDGGAGAVCEAIEYLLRIDESQT